MGRPTVTNKPWYQIPEPDQVQGPQPELLQQLQGMSQQVHMGQPGMQPQQDGVLGFLQGLGSFLTAAHNPQAYQAQQQQLQQQKMAQDQSKLLLGSASENDLPGPLKELALKQAALGQYDHLQHTLRLGRDLSKRNEEDSANQQLQQAAQAVVAQRGSSISGADMQIVKALLDHGDANAAVSYINQMSTKSQAETTRQAQAREQEVDTQLKGLTDNPDVQNVNGLVQSALSRNIPAEDLANIGSKQVAAKYGFKPEEGKQLAAGIQKLEASGVKVTQSPIDKVGQMLGISQPPAGLKDVAPHLTQQMLSPEAMQQQAQVEATRQALQNEKQSLQQFKSDNLSAFSSKPSAKTPAQSDTVSVVDPGDGQTKQIPRSMLQEAQNRALKAGKKLQIVK